MTMNTDHFFRTVTKSDLATIAKVYEETKYTTDDESLPGIILIRGPETGDLFKRNGKSAFQSVGPVGSKRAVKGKGVAVHGPERFDERFVERLFEGSLRWPKGLPVGITVHHTKTELGSTKYEPTCGTYDVPHAEMKRLKSMAYMKRHMTQRERRLDEIHKENVRMARDSADMGSFTDMLATAFANSKAKETAKTGAGT